MPEGLSPIEVGREVHEHTKEPHEPDGGNRHSRTVQIGEALLLSLVTIAAAWSGYAAAKWNTESRLELAQAATLRNLATRADLSALSTRNFDSSTFNAWFTAFTLDDEEAGHRRAALPPRVQGGLRRLDRDRSLQQPEGSSRAQLHARVQARRPGQGRGIGP